MYFADRFGLSPRLRPAQHLLERHSCRGRHGGKHDSNFTHQRYIPDPGLRSDFKANRQIRSVLPYSHHPVFPSHYGRDSLSLFQNFPDVLLRLQKRQRFLQTVVTFRCLKRFGSCLQIPAQP